MIDSTAANLDRLNPITIPRFFPSSESSDSERDWIRLTLTLTFTELLSMQ
jgi:hypothetical protein